MKRGERRRHWRHRWGHSLRLRLITVFVLAPMVFALWALLSESHALVGEIAAADQRGFVFPSWLQGMPLLGRVPAELSSPGALRGWAERINGTAFLGVARILS